MNWYLDVFSLDCMSDETLANLAAIQRLERECQRSEACEDDVESCSPYIGMLPDESNHEEVSPLNFHEPWPVTAGELTEANKLDREEHRENLRQRQQRQIRKAAKQAKRAAAKLTAMTVIA